jgi:hypothetical protein
MAKEKQKRSWAFWTAIGLTSFLAIVIASVWYYGSVILPGERASNLDQKNIEACELFRQGLDDASKLTDIDDAKQAVMVKVDDAITLYDPTFTNQDPDFGAVYESMLRVSDAGFNTTGNSVLDYGNFNHEVELATTLCQPILQAAIDTGVMPSPK